MSWAFWIWALLLLSAASCVLMLRWWFLLGWLVPRPPWRQAFLIYVQGWALLFTPARSGEALRAVWLQQRCDVPLAVGLAVLLAERITGLAAALLLLALGFSGRTPLGLTAVVVAVAAMLALCTHRGSLSALVHRLPAAIENGGWRNLPQRLMRQSLLALLHLGPLLRPWPMALGLGLALVSWLLESALLYGIWQVISDQPPAPMAAVLVRVVMGLSGFVSLLPAGLGVTDGTGVGLLLLYGLSTRQALVATALLRLLLIGFPLVLGWLAYVSAPPHRYARRSMRG
ncbi:flippase-like domain-containing protein [Cyanobium sp. WKJ7-Wakatipu]|nr:flippase-like domain-containing protein [Cyanobium sp. WKJ7-Wakatipu]